MNEDIEAVIERLSYNLEPGTAVSVFNSEDVRDLIANYREAVERAEVALDLLEACKDVCAWMEAEKHLGPPLGLLKRVIRKAEGRA